MSQRTITVKANSELTERAEGKVLACISATGAFDVIADIGNKFSLAPGQKHGIPPKSRRIRFIDTSGADNAITFYNGDEDIVLDASVSKRVIVQGRETISNTWAGSVANNGVVTFNGFIDPDGDPVVGAGGRKEFIVSASGSANPIYFLEDQGGTQWAHISTGDPQHFELEDSITVRNKTGSAITIHVNEVNWQLPS